MAEDKSPLRLNGAKFTADKTGLVRIVEPWDVYSLADVATFEPNPRPLGLPIVNRDAEEFVTGTWTLHLTYEGQASDSEVSFENSNAIEVELDTSMSQDPIKSHPNFEALKLKYNWNATKEEFAETLSDNGKASALGGNKKGRLNPAHGVDSYLVVGAIFRVTYTTRRPPPDVLENIGTIVDRPPGWSLLGLPHPKGRNWLKLGPVTRLAGNATRVQAEWMMSGPKGWLRDIYGAQQLRA